MDIALAGGNAYWTQGNGNVRFVNLRGTNTVFAMFRQGRIRRWESRYRWRESLLDGERRVRVVARVNSANLNGTGALRHSLQSWQRPDRDRP